MNKFIPLGGAGEIGANCYYLNIEGTGIILDCGMHPQKTGLESLPNFDLIEDEPVDFALISHAHQDHLSALPYLVKRHPYIKIITTPQTRALAELTLHNSISILKEPLNENDAMQIYSHDEVDLLIKSIEYKSYKEKFEINGYKHKSSESIYASFYDAGHILGSAGILIEYNGKSIFYSGDINLSNQAVISGADLPQKQIHTLILETTYGATDSSSILDWKNEAERLAFEANKIINKGGSILIPVFSLGKLQEMLKTIYDLMTKGKLTQVDIFTGGIGTKINNVYDYNRYVVNMIDKEFELKSIPQKNLYEVERYEDFFKYPCIVLASSGMMLPGTASFNLARRWIKQKDSAVFTVGYMDASTPGFIIANAKTGDKIKLTNLDDEQELQCEIKNFRFSAHSKREELVNVFVRLNPEKIILVHGDAAAIDWIGASILSVRKQRISEKKAGAKSVMVFAAVLGKEIELY
jgi:Cft2 family RNA processing exonuclease